MFGLDYVMSYLQNAPATEGSAFLEDAQRVLDILLKIISGAAIIIGGIWAYYKFVKGRTFEANLEPKVAGEAKKKEGTIYLVATADVKNIGASRIDIDHAHTALRVLTAKQAPRRPSGFIEWTQATSGFFEWTQAKQALRRPSGFIEWTQSGTKRVLTYHTLLEPGETAVDTELFQIRDEGYVALKLEIYVSSTEEEYWVGIGIVNLVEEI